MAAGGGGSQGMAECLPWRCTSVTRRPVLRSYQDRLSSSVVAPSCTMRFPDRSSGSASPRFSRQRRTRAASSVPMMIRASDPPINERRLLYDSVHNLAFTNALRFGLPEVSSEDSKGLQSADVDYIIRCKKYQPLFPLWREKSPALK